MIYPVTWTMLYLTEKNVSYSLCNLIESGQGMEMVESLFLEEFKSHGDMVLRDMG